MDKKSRDGGNKGVTGGARGVGKLGGRTPVRREGPGREGGNDAEKVREREHKSKRVSE